MKDGIVTIQRLDHIKSLIGRIIYKNWSFKADIMGNGCYIQPVLDVCDDRGANWTGRKWYVSNYAGDAEIVATIFKAVMTAEEHETREQFMFDNVSIFGPHLSLESLVRNANATAHRE